MDKPNFEDAKTAYSDFLVSSYKMWGGSSSFSVEVMPGHKYRRVVTNSGSSRSARSFLVTEDHTTSKGLVLKRGDILKAASWKAPALNFIRGNIFDPKSWGNIRWSGL